LKNFSAGTHLTLSKSSSDIVRTDAGASSGVITSAMKFNPILPIYEDEALGIYTLFNEPGIQMPNPIATAKEQVIENHTFRALGDVYAQWEILPNLKAKSSLGIDVFNNRSDRFTPSYIFEGSGIATASIGTSTSQNWLNENTLNYSRQINDKNFISALGGITFQKNSNEGFNASSQQFVNDVLKENDLSAGAVYNKPGSSVTEWSLISYLGRVNYNLMEKYLFSVNARMDGSSRFGKNNKYAFFPSAAFSWRLSEEGFVKNIGSISNLKLRTSYGFTGNQEIGLYNSLPTLANNTYTFGRNVVTGFFPNKIPNPDLKWEKSAQFDIGIDAGFFNERLRITSDYYHKKTTDLIYSVAVPFASGFASSLQNMGSVENKGVELAIESNNLTGKFEWSSHFNISFNRNKVLELGGESYKDIGSGDGHLKTGSVHRLIVGEPVGLFYGYQFDGIFQNQDELDAGPKSPTHWVGGRRYKDISGPEGTPDGVVDATYDRTIIGDPNPDFFGGFTNTFSYEGFELSAFLQYSYGNDIFNYNAIELELPTGGQNAYVDLVNRWTPENPSTVYPKATTNRSAVFSDRYIEDGSYLKMRNVTLAYNFNNLKLNHLNGVRVYVSGQNLLTFTKYRGYDPEVSFRGATSLEMGEDFGGYPQARTILMGVKLDIN
jgi:TonB-linked SusC/RagA family outer membrane protein